MNAAAQSVAQPALAEGVRLVASLNFDQAADAARFRAVGFDRALELLSAVVAHGERPEATRADWLAMHRAARGRVELCVAKGEIDRAVLFARYEAFLHETRGGNLEAALAASLRELALARQSKVQGFEHSSLAAVGGILIALKRPAEALAYLRRALALHPDPLSNNAATLWQRIIEAELTTGTTRGAREAADAFAVAAKSGPMEFRTRAELAAAGVDLAEGAFHAALDRVRAAREIASAAPSTEWITAIDAEAALVLLKIVLDATRALPYADAIALAGRIDEQFRGLTIDVAPFARQALKTRRLLSGEFDAVIRDDTEALRAARAANSITGQIEVLRSLAVTYRTLNAKGHQIALLEEARDLETRLFENGKPANSVAAANYYDELLSLAESYLSLGQTEKAAGAFAEVQAGIEAISEAASREPLASQLAAAYLGRAAVAEKQDDPTTARQILENALAGRPADATFNRSDILVQLARLERDSEPAAAVAHYKAAIVDVAADRNRRYEILLRLELARYLAAVATTIPDRLAQAQAELAIVERVAQALNDPNARWRVRYVTGIVAEAAGQRRAAIEHYRDAVSRLDEIRAGLGAQEARASFVDNEAVEDLYRRVVRLLTIEGRRDAAWEFLERGKARAFLELLQGRRFRTDEAGSEALRGLERRIVDLRVQLSLEVQLAPGGTGREAGPAAAQLHALEQKFALERQLASVSVGRATQPLVLRSISLSLVQQRLPERSALLEYALLGDRVTAFVVTRRRVRQLVWTADTAALRSEVTRLTGRTGLLQYHDTMEAAAESADAIAPMLVEKVLEALPPSIDHLIIVPAEYLTYLPFEVLPVGKGQLVIDRFSVSYLPSASTLQFLTPPTSSGGSSARTFLGALGDLSVEGKSPLPETLREVNEIAGSLPRASVVTEREFTHAEAVKALQTYDRVHFATHGLLDEDAPIFSGLLMSGEMSSPTRLSLYDITELRVTARLIVLSACETGLGRMLRGDEVTGLTRTFLQAGATTVVSSLWQVADDSTALLMQQFYMQLDKGLTPSQALRQASLSLRREGQYTHPFYWAPFIVTGLQ